MTATKTPAAPVAEPTLAELEQIVAEAQARLQAARDAETVKERMTTCQNLITDAANSLDEAADSISNGKTIEDITEALTTAIGHCKSAIVTLVPEPEQPARTRNGHGALRPLVKRHLDDHTTESFKAGEIAKELDRSSGAVSNALDALVRDGEAKITSESGAVKTYQAVVPAT